MTHACTANEEQITIPESKISNPVIRVLRDKGHPKVGIRFSSVWLGKFIQTVGSLRRDSGRGI
jgi:hypothetical protein